jgi:hypothetical protein
VLKHRAAVMSDQDAALPGGNFQDIGIRNPFKFVVRRRSEVDGRLTLPNRNNKSVMDIGVSLKPDQ